jgi:hypothetical protein
MNWLVVAVIAAMVSTGRLATYCVSRAHRRKCVHRDPAPVAGSRRFAVRGPDIACGIDAVDREGHVIGTVLVPAPSMN